MKPDYKTLQKYPEVQALSNYGFLTRSIRKLILKSLDDLQYGRLKIIEQDITTEVGKGDILVNAEIKVNDPSFFVDVFTKGSIGAAESYILKKWDTDDLDNVMRLFALNKSTLSQVDSGLVNLLKPARLIEYWQDRNTIDGSKKNIKAHYDLPDELFEHFLDESMMYSSAFFENEESTLEEAQQAKLKLIAERLDIRAENRILEIGSGWGALAIYLAKNYDCHVTTTTISDNQYRVTKERIAKEGLEDKITLLKDDYRLLKGEYDRVVSIEMIEAVGEQFLDSYTQKISDLLVEDGLALLQIITINDQEYDRAVKELDFIKKFIFPGSFIPSIHAVLSSFKSTSDMRLYNQVDFTSHYARTLEEWKKRFNTNTHEIPKLGEDEEFIRLWNFYFSYCIGGFHERAIGVSHLTFGKPLYRN
ncbi:MULTISPECIES: SAM-dependent methyltransferase [Halobacteriovorax]|uniref:Class I SAM-dependent methyltransferase n=1 Tax=Halobacteriovorax vibrionivorans TaxID=2152716 RepID=A0ABY0IF28_9BACT|nr:MULTISPECIES: cyclopropane-fatty-acyl-phospholipid synthase family protein [Halobacteriovorax]AYF43907.1 cyclopropane-fatty-acyl-phospholipid synthase [Halobacteriovorax sp. BALOs_7]RZF21561.1 class I SAM-dependent methyltransferase [Halobacteriovorax vibrionivorans]TGD49146.1 class I SAM-dependent methyltransferase [Halobacteriovorax sp. Y22]